MKKSEKIQAAKKVAVLHTKGEMAEAKKLGKILAAEGCNITKDGDGFVFADNDGKSYQLVVRGKLVIQYDRNDWIEYRALDEMLAESRTKRTAKDVAALLDNVRAESLRKKLIEQIEARGVEVEQPKAEKKPKATKKSTKKAAPKSTKKSAAKPKKQKVEVLPKDEQQAEIKKLMKKLKGVKFEVIGTWVWATGETKANKDALIRAGFYFSANKQAWYWKPENSAPRRRSSYKTMDGVRNYWNNRQAA